jgi:plasmid stabilization system protein ParE
MTRRISFHPLAEQELNEAASYYNAASPGLGTAFLDEVERAIKQVLEHPKAASLVNRVVRRKLVRRFPYSVLYSVQTDTIRVLVGTAKV